MKDKSLDNYSNNLSIKNYIYLDEIGIDSIYSQLNEETVREITIKQSNDKSGKLSISAGLSKLKNLFTADTELSGKLRYSSELEKTISLSYEQKIKIILKEISNYKNYFCDLNIALRKNIPANQIVFINIYESFYSRLDFSSYEVFKYIHRCNYLEFEKGDMPLSPNSMITYDIPYDNYNYHDNYYKESRYRVVLSMNLDKLRIPFHSQTSHLAVALRGSRGKISLGVWGQLRRINDLYYQIKPFAVWW